MADQPNILVICGDHLRHDMLHCNGNDFIRTPNVDALAAGGVSFRNSFTPNPICVPGRASITTGNYSHRATNSKGNGGEIHTNQPRLADHFARNGYRTYAIGKLHYVPYSPPGQPRLLHGFQHAELCEEGRVHKLFDPQGKLHGLEDYHDYLYEVGWGGYERAHGIGNNDVRPTISPVPAEHYVDAWVATRTIANLEKHLDEGADAPFMVFASFTKPHSAYDPPEPWHAMYDPREVPEPIGGPELLAGRSPNLENVRRSHGQDELPPQLVQLARARYMAQVSFQDEQIGRMLDFLDERGLAENTIVMYTADHGDLLGDFGTFFKTNMLNGSVRVPLVVRAPGVCPAGSQRDQLVGLQDILPTLAGLTGLPLEAEVDGMDLTSVLRDDAPGRDVYVSQSLGSPWQTYMLCDGASKYIYSEANATEEFYDLVNDPNELVNLVTSGGIADTDLAQWRERLLAWCVENGDEQMVKDGRLASADADVESIKFHAGRMGWRYF